MNRRKFLELAAGTGASASASNVLGLHTLLSPMVIVPTPAPFTIVETMAAGPATYIRPYCSKPVNDPNLMAWVQVDLGSRQVLEAIRLYPSPGVEGEDWPYPFSFSTFPRRFRIEASDDRSFTKSSVIADCTGADFTDPRNKVLEYPASGRQARYIRLTVTGMTPLPKTNTFAFALSKVSVLSAGKDLAEGCSTSADEISANPGDLAQLTRPPRPQGEGIGTDNPGNVIPENKWMPVQYVAQAPHTGVTLQGGVFQTTLENNIGYLLNSFSVDELLRQFRQRAGKPVPPNLRKPDKFWEEDLAGSNAGRFLMGAGNTLRWIDHPELRSRLNAVIDGIDDCKQPNGYIMAYPEETIFFSERGAYTRAWLTHGLIEAGYSGNDKAFGLLRGYYDWFNRCSYLPELLRRAGMGPQGMIANTRTYFTPVGTSGDIQVIQRYFQENYWLADLSARKPEAMWQYPYDRPHCYLLTYFEAYLDIYRATGDHKYLDAMLGGWQLYHDNWEHVGGSAAMEELVDDPPKAYRLDHKHGELCGSSFWVFFNQRFHSMYPEEEKYVTEIEKSIYNVAIANQAGSEGIRYFAVLIGPKEKPYRINTCCEGQGTRLLGSLPEHIYSLARDGVYVNLFEPSSLSWNQQGETLHITMRTSFPADPKVTLLLDSKSPIRAKMRIRVPSWAPRDMDVMVNAARVATGSPGTYVSLDRTWSAGDQISFTVPIRLKLTRYEGANQVPGHERYALEYGPFLLAAVGANEITLEARPEELLRQLTPIPDRPLHFKLAGNDLLEYMPYWQIKEQPFSCFPLIRTRTELVERIGSPHTS
jgi:DUF1680 family protein